mmetsp:Transcript_26997/g.41419  ORF Transcript_26997/g.41419 Transcript_26997/m.41419 type:complete len:475 (-) Transcript_26997:446-1870(-)
MERTYGSIETGTARIGTNRPQTTRRKKKTTKVSPQFASPKSDRNAVSSPYRSNKKREKGKGVFNKLYGPNLSSLSTIRDANHSWLYSLLNPKSCQPHAVVFKHVISVVIIFDLVSFIFSTEPTLKDYHIFYVIEGFTSTIFLLEYIARIITITEKKKYGTLGPIAGRLRYMMSFSAIVDACATLPFFIELLFQLQLPRLTYLRFFRLLRILKTESFSKAMDSLVRVIYYNGEILYVALILGIFLVMFTGILLYYLRPKDDPDGYFRSIGTTMYVSTLMLTGQGGPETNDLPWYTKSIVLMTGVFSIGMFAIPASMLTWGFEAEAQRVAARTKRRMRRGYYSSTSSSSNGEDDDDISTSSQEYLNIIAGDEDDDELLKGKAGSDREIAEAALENFKVADRDGSGFITKREFLEAIQKSQPSFTKNILEGESGIKQPGDAVASLSLEARIQRLEGKVDETNERLDRVLVALEGKLR